jgi:hypothetical protein
MHAKSGGADYQGNISFKNNALNAYWQQRLDAASSNLGAFSLKIEQLPFCAY